MKTPTFVAILSLVLLANGVFYITQISLQNRKQQLELEAYYRQKDYEAVVTRAKMLTDDIRARAIVAKLTPEQTERLRIAAEKQLQKDTGKQVYIAPETWEIRYQP